MTRNKICLGSYPLSLLLLFACVSDLAAAPATGSITRHVWTGIAGTNIADLTGLSQFPDNPNIDTVSTSFLAPTNFQDNYGTRMFGWVHAPVTANYTFYLHGDDDSELWLSSNTWASDRVRIASIDGWTDAGDYSKFASQTSVEIPLVAGQYYYIEALHKEGSGGDNLGVAWSYPGQALSYIPGSQLSPIQNLPPALQDDHLHLAPGGVVMIPILGNDIDPNHRDDLQISTLRILSGPTLGSVSLDSSSGRATYSHSGSTTGNDSFTYEIKDAQGLAGTATGHITISDAPRLPLQTSTMPGSAPPQTLSLENAFPGLSFSQPLGIVTPPGESNRLFVLEKNGNVQVIPDLSATTPSASTFLDLDGLVNGRSGEAFQTSSEQGLLGLAFHPNYANNGRFFVVYSLNINGARYQRLSEFSVSSNNANLADPTSEVVILEQRNEAGNHNGGDIHFGPDGYLYMAWGDEGGGNDQFNNAQTITKDFWSSITRIDIDLEVEDYTAADGSDGDDQNLPPNAHAAIVLDGNGNPRYEVPVDNPWVGATTFNGQSVTPSAVRSEFWAVGLRNPWRMSFDPQTGNLWVGDVGQGAREEVNIIVAGGNYEWAYTEGTINGPKWGQRPSGWAGGVAPIYDYSHGSGNFQGRSITGGVVYRSSKIEELVGQYIFADYVSGNIWALDNSGATPEVRRIAGEGGIVGFGYDPRNGDVLMADIDSGVIRKISAQNQLGDFPQTLSATGLFQDVANLTPNPGLVPYEINLSFWSDHALKQRWFGHPEVGPQFIFSPEGGWTHPTGSIWVKHFDLETVRGNPATKKRIETRVLVKTDEATYGVSYRWNEAGTEATLADAAGENIDLTIDDNGTVRQQQWRIPSQADCRSCHTPAGGHALSFTTRQLNREGQLSGLSGNFISLLQNAGYLEPVAAEPQSLPRHVAPDEVDFSREARARAWLEVNCSYCHTADGPQSAAWDTLSAIPLFATGMINGMLTRGATDPADRLIVPGSDQHSAIVNRMAVRNGYTRMPPIGSNEIDQEAVDLLIAWIQNDLPNRQSYADWRSEHFGTDANGAPEIDADGDGRNNQQEYLEQTDPKLVDARPVTNITASGGQLTLTAPDLPGRGVWFEESPDLIQWKEVLLPGNNGLARPPGQPLEAIIVPGQNSYFYRARIEER